MSKAKKTNNLLKLLQEKIDTNEFFSFELNRDNSYYFPFGISHNDNLSKTYSNIIKKSIEESILISDDFKNEVIDVYLNEHKTIKKFLEKNKISLIYEDEMISNANKIINKDFPSCPFKGAKITVFMDISIALLRNHSFIPQKIIFTNDLEYYKLLNY